MECQKPLTFLHKEKNNLSVSKGCYEERCWSSNKNLSNFPVSNTKTDLKATDHTSWSSDILEKKSNEANVCVDVTQQQKHESGREMAS